MRGRTALGLQGPRQGWDADQKSPSCDENLTCTCGVTSTAAPASQLDFGISAGGLQRAGTYTPGCGGSRKAWCGASVSMSAPIEVGARTLSRRCDQEAGLFASAGTSLAPAVTAGSLGSSHEVAVPPFPDWKAERDNH